MWLSSTDQRVKLLDDLTRYDPRCKIGEKGWLLGGVKFSFWDSQDRFGAVKFDNGAKLSVLLKGLKFLKETREATRQYNSFQFFTK